MPDDPIESLEWNLWSDSLQGLLRQHAAGLSLESCLRLAYHLAVLAPSPFSQIVDAGCDETGAARHDEMADAVERHLLGQRGDRGQAQRRRGPGVQLHPGRGSGQRAGIEAAHGDRRSAAGRAIEHRPAMCDSRAPGHPLEQLDRTRILNLVARPIDEGVVDIVIRHGGADGVHVRHDRRQGRLSGRARIRRLYVRKRSYSVSGSVA